jgi:hypothetical protein
MMPLDSTGYMDQELIGCFESQGYTGNEDELSPSAGDLQLANYPNPFNPSTTITYTLPKPSEIRLSVYNLKGQLVRSLTGEFKAAGTHQVVWDGKDNLNKQASSGVYFIRLQAGRTSLTHKVLLMK